MSSCLKISGDMEMDGRDPVVAMKDGRIGLHLDNREGLRIFVFVDDIALLARQLQDATKFTRV